MEIKFFQRHNTFKEKATITNNGNLRISKKGVELMGLKTGQKVNIGISKDSSHNNALFIVPTDTGEFELKHSGGMYYLNTTPLMKDLNIDYKDCSISYSISMIEYENKPAFKLTMNPIQQQ